MYPKPEYRKGTRNCLIKATNCNKTCRDETETELPNFAMYVSSVNGEVQQSGSRVAISFFVGSPSYSYFLSNVTPG